MFGGYSSTNYRVEGKGKVAMLKIMNGYDREWVEGQTAIQRYLQQSGFSGACFPLPIANEGSKVAKGYVSVRGGTPSCLLTFLPGTNAERALETNHALRTEDVLSEIGRGLAQLHSVAVSPDAKLRDYKKGGACLVIDHINDIHLVAFESSPHTKNHPFLPFYKRALVDLKECMKPRNLPTGIIHGDPFLDNVLIDAKTGALSAFVDWEDVTVGPLLFDLACCIIGTCYREGDDLITESRMLAILKAYAEVRPLTKDEMDLLPRFMRMTLLCNCAWRFKNFNIDHRELEENRNAHVELKDRILALEGGEGQSRVEKVIAMVKSGENGNPVRTKESGHCYRCNVGQGCGIV